MDDEYLFKTVTKVFLCFFFINKNKWILNYHITIAQVSKVGFNISFIYNVRWKLSVSDTYLSVCDT